MITESAIEIKDLTVRYGSVLALDSVSVDIPERGITGLIGMNGSGKSTLFKSVMGVVSHESGLVRVAGHSPAEARKRGLVGFVPQSEDVDWTFPVSVRDVVMMGRFGRMGATRRARRADVDAVASAIDRVGLTAFADRQIGRLSGGQRKRAFVARGIAQEATIMLLDEPFAGVDKTTEAKVVSVLHELADEGVTILVSTHDLHALPRLADRAVLLQRRVVYSGPVAEALRPENLSRAFGLEPSAIESSLAETRR